MYERHPYQQRDEREHHNPVLFKKHITSNFASGEACEDYDSGEDRAPPTVEQRRVVRLSSPRFGGWLAPKAGRSWFEERIHGARMRSCSAQMGEREASEGRRVRRRISSRYLRK